MKQVPKETIDTYIQQMKEEGKMQNSAYPEIDIIREKGPENEQVKINMDFLGLDLSQIPNQNMQDYRVYIIPVLYIISSVISMKITTAMQKQQNTKKKEAVIDVTEKKEGEEGEENKQVEKEEETPDISMQTNKTMSWLIPIMAISIAFVAPLGLALYWLVNNVLMIVERIALNKFLKDEE
jgi:membrane protein insertase Oxa1/YidC/SpoIIIJ